MKALGRIFLNSRKERQKDVKTEFFFVKCRRTYVLNKYCDNAPKLLSMSGLTIIFSPIVECLRV